jgi:hypothetical protein
MSNKAAHRLGAIDNALEEKGGRLSVILCNEATVCGHRRQLVSKHPLIERDQIAVPCCLLESGEL